MNKEKRYNIVLENMENFVLASCKDLEFAKKYLKDMEKNDKWLAKYYGWQNIPKYKIIESEEEK